MARRVTLMVLVIVLLAACGSETTPSGTASSAAGATAAAPTATSAPTETTAPSASVTSAPTVAPTETAAPEATATTEPRALAWQELPAHGDRPAARRDPALIWDSARKRLIMFGGKAADGSALDDTWAFDVVFAKWEELAAEVRPPARFSTIAGVDVERDRVLITTGDSGAGHFFNDVWSLDLATDTWSELEVDGDLPRPRYGSAGGIFPGGDALYVTHGFSDQGRFDDTWAFDLGSGAWENRTPEGELPLKRCLHAAALTGPDDLVLFGGCSSGFGPCPQGDTWLLEGGAWSQVESDEQPSARQHPGLVAMADGSSALLFGGIAEGQSNQNDLWRLDPAAGSWSLLQPEGTVPAPRNGHAVVEVDGDVFVFGGQGESGLFDDLWWLVGARG